MADLNWPVCSECEGYGIRRTVHGYPGGTCSACHGVGRVSPPEPTAEPLAEPLAEPPVDTTKGSDA